MKNEALRRVLSFLVAFSLIFQQAGFAQGLAQLDISRYLGVFSGPEQFRPLQLRYFSYNPITDNFQLLLDKGTLKKVEDSQVKEQGQELLKYFLVGVALPDENFWVNLRPDSEDEIISQELAETDVGKILLEADLQLKKDVARFTSPETTEGREYWNKLYRKAGELFSGENITIPTLTRPWIVPGEVIIRETETSAYVYKGTLKVMLEQDHLKNSADYNFTDPRLKELNEYSSELIRETIIPKLTREVNSSKRYAQLRQVFFSLILSRWFKHKFAGQKGLIPKGTVPVYVNLINSGNLNGLTSQQAWSKTTYFEEYKKSFAQGEYNLKEQVYIPTFAAGGSAFGGGPVIRSYFSGGISILPGDFKIPTQADPTSPTRTFKWTGSSPIVTRLLGNDMVPLAGAVLPGEAVPVLESATNAAGVMVGKTSSPVRKSSGEIGNLVSERTKLLKQKRRIEANIKSDEDKADNPVKSGLKSQELSKLRRQISLSIEELARVETRIGQIDIELKSLRAVKASSPIEISKGVTINWPLRSESIVILDIEPSNAQGEEIKAVRFSMNEDARQTKLCSASKNDFMFIIQVLNYYSNISQLFALGDMPTMQSRKDNAIHEFISHFKAYSSQHEVKGSAGPQNTKGAVSLPVDNSKATELNKLREELNQLDTNEYIAFINLARDKRKAIDKLRQTASANVHGKEGDVEKVGQTYDSLLMQLNKEFTDKEKRLRESTGIQREAIKEKIKTPEQLASSPVINNRIEELERKIAEGQQRIKLLEDSIAYNAPFIAGGLGLYVPTSSVSRDEAERLSSENDKYRAEIAQLKEQIKEWGRQLNAQGAQASSAVSVEERVKSTVAEQLGVDPEKVTPKASFVVDLGADSLEITETVLALEDEFNIEIPDEDVEKITTVGKAVELVIKYINEKTGAASSPAQSMQGMKAVFDALPSKSWFKKRGWIKEEGSLFRYADHPSQKVQMSLTKESGVWESADWSIRLTDMVREGFISFVWSNFQGALRVEIEKGAKWLSFSADPFVTLDWDIAGNVETVTIVFTDETMGEFHKLGLNDIDVSDGLLRRRIISESQWKKEQASSLLEAQKPGAASSPVSVEERVKSVIAVEERVKFVIAKVLGKELVEVTSQKDLFWNFGVISHDRPKITKALEEEFFILIPKDAENFVTVDDVVKYIKKQITAKATAASSPVTVSDDELGSKLEEMIKQIKDKDYPYNPAKKYQVTLWGKTGWNFEFGDNVGRIIETVLEEIRKYRGAEESRYELVTGDNYGYTYSKNNLIITMKPSSPVVSSSMNRQDTPGGIDFRVINMITQPMGNLSGLNFSLPHLSNLENINLSEELEQIQRMLQAGIIPSGERLKEYVAACYQKGELKEHMDGIVASIVDTCKLEEEKADVTSNALKEVMLILDSVS